MKTEKEILSELKSRHAVIDQIRVRILRCMDDISGQDEDSDIIEALDEMDEIINRRLTDIETAIDELNGGN